MSSFKKKKRTNKPTLPNGRHDHWCLSTLLKRGWTPQLIKKLLPPPRLAKNPHGGPSAMKEWQKDYVLGREQQHYFRVHRNMPTGWSGEALVQGQF
ncbi:hypothetical protein BH09SUM1_BH09SUM1_00690 [soil metagenome]